MPLLDPAIKIAALAGGVGGSRLVRGMAEHLAPHQLSIIVNTGDDFEHLGLHISPDVDTMLYNLSDQAQIREGWGIQNDSHSVMSAIAALGGPTWFSLGDRDLATHLTRTHWLREGNSLTEVTRLLAEQMGIRHLILPMSDQPCRTMIETIDGEQLDFQTYFVRERCLPVIRRLYWQGSATAQPTPQVIQALTSCNLVVICPSNPFVSVDPILNLPGVREIIQRKPVLAMSPIIGGMAVKGPAAKMFQELRGQAASVNALLEHYGSLLRGLVIDLTDQELLPALRKQVPFVEAMPTLMLNRQKQIEVAAGFLSAAACLLKV